MSDTDFTATDLQRAASAALRRSDRADVREGQIASATAHVAAHIAHDGRIPHAGFFDDAIVARAERIEAFAEWRDLHAWAQAAA